ncbi:MAG: HlyD family efflux transporter periplasmic adaptor subunit [Pirellulales bacterium]|nr:HlyD family efflux transporter periplasmic adaptor subunit [Pirellulales bacterium]
MKRSSPLNLSAVDRPLELRARADLQTTPVTYSGQSAYVVKDPLTLEMFHLTAAEHFLLQVLQQPTSLSAMQREFQHRFAPQRISPESLQHGLNQLHSQGLLLSTASGQGEQLSQRGRRQWRQQQLQRLLSLLSFRLGSVDATRLVDGLHQRVRWLFSVPALLVALATVFYAVWILLAQGSAVLQRLPSLQSLAEPKYWLLWLATIALVKVIHELAHAVTCQHLGGRCHEIGMLLLACLPCLYCDVSDVWRLPSKWRRIAVSAAGMIAELLLATLALIAWWHTQPGLLNIWCLSVVIVCSVGTLLVNANPLLRYDGYYILADLVEVPNLSSRAQGLLPTALRRWLLGQPREDDPLLTARQRRGMLVYAIAARLYLLFVILGIFVVLLAWASPYRAENLVYTLGVLTVFGMLFRPLSGVWRLARNPSVRARLRRGRAALLVGAAIAVLGFILLWPIAQTVQGPVVFVPVEGQTVYATAPGELQYAVPPGTQVQQGDVVARLRDAETELTLARQTGEYQVRRVRYEQLGTMRAWDEQASLQLPTARAALADAESLLAEVRRNAQELTLRAPQAGTVIAPPELERNPSDEDRLSSWAGSPLDARNLGCWIEPGTPFCMIGDPAQLEVLAAVDQADVAEVEPGQQANILLSSAPVRVLEGTVLEVARRSHQRTPTEPALDAGKYHLVRVQLHAPQPQLPVGSRGIAKIEARRNTLGAILSHSLRQMLRLPW